MTQLGDLQASLDDIRARKAALDTQVRTAPPAQRATLMAQQASIASEEANAVGKLVGLGDPRKVVEQLDDGYPFVLFPLRIETRFIAQGDAHSLWIRIYPDDCQVQTFTDFISSSELTDTQSFWISFWKAGGVIDQERAAWRGLVAAHGSGRSQLLVGRYKPVGTAPVKASSTDVILVVWSTLALTATEQTAATAYWIAAWRAGEDAVALAAATSAFDAAVGGAARAGQIIAGWAPTNFSDLPTAPFTRASAVVSLVTIDLPATATVTTTTSSWNGAPRATTLPDCFIAVGVQAGTTVFNVQGAPVPSVLPVGPDPTLADADQIQIANGELTLNSGLRWMASFDEAVRIGMGLKIPLTPAQYNAGFDQITVLGLRLSSGIEASTELLEAMLQDHSASKSGLAILPQGTPTNNTDDTSSGYSWTDDPDESFDRVFGTASTLPLSSDPLQKRDGQWLAEALGINVGVVSQIPYAEGNDQALARAMNTALWPTTWGYFFNTMVGPGLPSATAELVRQFFVRYISGRGAVPAIRVAKNPYGILPATVQSRLTFEPAAPAAPKRGTAANPPGATEVNTPRPSDAREIVAPIASITLPVTYPWSTSFLMGLQKRLDQVRSDFQSLYAGIPHVGEPSQTPANAPQILIDVVSLLPSSVDYFQRYVMTLEQIVDQMNNESVGLGFFAALILGALKKARGPLLQGLGLDPTQVPMLDKMMEDDASVLTGGTIDDQPLSETSPIRAYAKDGKNYLEWLVASTFDTIRTEDFGGNAKPSALLYLLARYALLLVYYNSSVTLLASAGLASEDVLRTEPTYIQVGTQSGASKWQYLVQPAQKVTGNATMTVADYLDSPGYRIRPESAAMRAVLAGLSVLEDASTAALERAFAEHIDLCTYRLDAWRLGLVHHRLQQQRDKHARGAYLGAYGWLTNVRPKNYNLQPVTVPPQVNASFTREGRAAIKFDPTNEGYIHAPSIAQATTAAVLRNAYLTNATAANPGAMQINLSSARVRRAMQIVEGIQEGQDLASLLGYQFERNLHDAHLLAGTELEQFQLAIREAYPMVANKTTTTQTPTEVDAAAARTVVDGVLLVEAVRTSVTGYPWKSGLPAATAAQKAALDAQANQLLDTADAVGDLMLAETVHHAVTGQATRAVAASDVLAAGVPPQDPEVTRTPRSGLVQVHRFAVVLDPGASAASGANPRTTAEPAIDAWLAARLPSPASVGVNVHWHDPSSGDHAAVVTQADLGLSATDVLQLLSTDGTQGVSELDDRIQQFVHTTYSPHPGAQLLIDYTLPLGGKVSLFELTALVRDLRAIVLASRSLAPTDLVRASDASSAAGPAGDVSELTARASAALATLATHVTALQALEADTSSTAEVYLDNATAGLLSAALHGVPQPGTSSLRAQLVGLYTTVTTMIGAVTTRWDARVAEYNAIVAGLAALPSDTARMTQLVQAEGLVSTVDTSPLPATTAAYQAIIAPKLAAFTAKLAALKALPTQSATRLADWFTTVEAAIATIPAFDALAFDPSRKANDLAPQRAALATLRSDVAARVTAVRTVAQARIASAQQFLVAASATTDVDDALAALDSAIRQAVGDTAKILPRFTLAIDPAEAFQSSFAASASTLASLTAGGREFPVDDWLYGAARVRAKLASWENVTALVEAFGGIAPELTPVQLPYQANDAWTALELPAGYTLSGEKLLFTASFTVPFDPAASQCGLVVDEWTEVVPGTQETTGIAFHFDQPNQEPPQAILLAVPPKLQGSWQWQDLLDTVASTMDEAQLRAVEPDHVAGSLYGQFLPATLVVVTESAITMSVNLLDNNQ